MSLIKLISIIYIIITLVVCFFAFFEYKDIKERANLHPCEFYNAEIFMQIDNNSFLCKNSWGRIFQVGKASFIKNGEIFINDKDFLAKALNNKN